MSLIDNYSSIDISDLRKEAEERLQWCYAHNHISIELLERRLDDLHKTDDKIKIIELVQDLPSPEQETQDSSDDGTWYHSGTGKKGETYFSLLGSNSRKGAWDVPTEMDVTAILGSQELDFREARFPRKTVVIKAFTFMGSIDLKLPRGVQISTSGVPILGSIENKVESDASGPRIEVEGVVMLGSITAYCPREKKKRRRK